VDVLKYYESIEIDSDASLQKFAVYRWLVNKKKQELLYRQRRNLRSAEKAEREYSNKLHDWEHRRTDIKRSDVEKEPPYPILDRIESFSHVVGLPIGTQVDDLGSGIRFKVGDLEIKTNWIAHRLLLTRDDLSSISINLQTSRAVSDDIEVLSRIANGVFHFEVPLLQCTGFAISTGEALRVNLAFQAPAEAIVLDFPALATAHSAGH
jgi:hypothetical protein